MNESTMVNVTTMQCHRYYIGISMSESIIANVATIQRRRYYVGVSMNESIIANVATMQRRRCCSFDSPGLARNEPTLGKRSQGDSTP
ncbi:tetrahydrofolate synthase [Prevotella salivae]|uniref:Tetrahydrofolate synthase n=2 Tax=Segatella salivae TaxID=228604 RepID=A0AAW4NT22_9BACT|nr:tetrahydrofolate synthase [Segatella salivae]MBW4865979.1 tetrahydrofolate synthase [Segatella salivae]MBW4910023.1 tetrahydrofolate synthase [Segatella salivae]